jgi:two-component system, cell cycle sensor histidine kinase and response regulator CckA
VNAEDFARRLEDMRRHVETIRGTSDSSSAAFEELLVAVEELRVAEEELREQNEQLTVAHAAVAEERRRYQHLFQYAPDAYLLTDLNGIIREANHSAAHLLGVQPRFLAGKTLVSFVALEDRPRLRGEIDRWQSEPAAKSIELRLRPRGGQPFDASLTLSVARGGPRDKAFGFRWLVRDISAHHQLTQELRLREETARREAEASEAHAYHVQKLESIGVLAGGIAHDFNNLLHVVLGNADLARLHVPGDSEAREHLDEVVRATQRAAELTQQLLAYSGRGAVESRQLDLSREVREMATLLRTAISKQATLEWDLAEDLPPVTADPTQLRQIVMNLITNASDALGDGSGTITLRTGPVESAESAAESPASVFLEVSDTGCGMDSSTLQRIFDPFFSTKFAGRGLGLAAVMGIVESHEGHVRIRTAPGEGTSFRVVLPAVSGDAEPAPRRLSGAGWRGRGTVLMVEDEEGVREVVGRMLERLGFHVITAVDGQDAIRAFDEHDGEVTAVLLDLSMPRMGGPETVRLLRQRSPELPVVLMSGYTEEDAASKLLDGLGGTVGFLHKPFLSEDLSGVLRQIWQSAIA